MEDSRAGCPEQQIDHVLLTPKSTAAQPRETSGTNPQSEAPYTAAAEHRSCYLHRSRNAEMPHRYPSANMDSVMTEDNTNIFAFPNSSPQSLRSLSSPQTPTEIQDEMITDTLLDDYTPSPHILNDSEDDYSTEDDLVLPDPAPSGRSSISSFPASVVHHDVVPNHTFDGLITPSRSRAGTPTCHQQNYKPLSPISTREHLTGFRNPSSVRALQMRDEFSDSEDLTPNHRRRGSRMSYVSYRSGSTHSTPGKRTSRSLQGSPVKNTSRLRKEFPLVLLHCSLIPSMINPKAGLVNEELLEAIVPEPYKKRWKLLQEKVIRNREVRDRGVLIPHPKEDYDILEERLLESLELERPVISNGHYVGRSESRASTADSGFGSEENSNRGDTTDEEEESKCADCGGHVCGDRRWEVKVFAANGLMKAGAWSAAWSEMEKVDVQVSVALPEDVRQEIEARLDAVIAQEEELQQEDIQSKELNLNDDRTKEIYGESVVQKKQEEIDGLSNDVPQIPKSEVDMSPELEIINTRPLEYKPPLHNVDLQDALKNYIQLLLQDRRNLAIILLSVLLIFYGASSSIEASIATESGIASKQTTETQHETRIEYLTTTIFSTSTSIALETSTVIETTSLSLPPSSSTSVADLGSTTSTTSLAEVTDTSTVSTESEERIPTTSAEILVESSSEPSTAIEIQPSISEDFPSTSTILSNRSEDTISADETINISLPEPTIPTPPLEPETEFERDEL